MIALGRSNEKLGEPFILHSTRWRTARLPRKLSRPRQNAAMRCLRGIGRSDLNQRTCEQCAFVNPGYAQSVEQPHRKSDAAHIPN